MKEKSQDKSGCLKRAAEARRFARETGDGAEKADLFSVECPCHEMPAAGAGR